MKKFTTAVLIILICLSGCKPDSDQPCREALISPVSLPGSESAKIPFAGSGDTLVYVGNSGDSIKCVGMAKILWYKTFPVKANPDCPDDSTGYVINQYNYADSLSKLLFGVTTYAYDTLLKVNANNSVFNILISKIGTTDPLTYFDSMQFGNKMFYKVNSFVNTGNDSLYYNSSYGMICLKQATQRFYIARFNRK